MTTMLLVIMEIDLLKKTAVSLLHIDLTKVIKF
jgi:hypothetical protein